jgi:sugar lactone lactonase YvrE
MKKTFWLIPILLAIPLLAVTPQFWEIRTYDDFRRGKLTNVSLTSDSGLVLAPRLDTVFNTEQTFVWSAVADSKANVYLGTGHDGKIFRVDPSGRGEMIADLNELDVLALAIDSKDVLYAGTSPDGKVYKIEPGQTAQEFYDPDVKYIWSLAFDRQGRLLVATGDQGVIYRVTPDGRGESFYDTDETHVVAMVVDRDGNVIAGGDPKGYVYRISPEGKAFVLYDSGMREVHAIALGPNGTIYAAVISGRSVINPGSSPSTTTTSTGGGEASVTVTVGAGSPNAAQQIEVIEPLSDPQAPSSSGQTAARAGNDGNAQSQVLEILPDGTVNTLWRGRDEMVFSLLPRAGKLLFSTGTKGRIYSIEDARNTTLLLESTEEQTTRLLEAGSRVYAASANVGKLFSVADVLAGSGEYESIIKDTDAISTWGKLSWKAESPNLIVMFTRTGNTSAPDKTWSEWIAADASGASPSPKARFIQWKAVLKADAGRSPRLSSVTVPYLQQNFRPEVTNLDVLPSGVALVKLPVLNPATGSPDPATARSNARTGIPAPPRIPPRRVNQRGAQSFQWTAADKNQDLLRYDLFYHGDNERNWKPLKTDLEDTFFTINSDTLPDGTYVVRVAASDHLSNPANIALTGGIESRPFSIDNTPPAATLRQENIEGRRVRIAIDAADPTSTLNQAEVSIDTGEWRPVFPADGILDSKSETFMYVTPELSPGEHVIAFRVYDQVDNAGMGKLVVRIP